MRYTFKNELVSKEALGFIIGKKYAYILDTVEYVLDFEDNEKVNTSVDVWVGDSGNIYISVFYERTTIEPWYKRLACAHFVIEKKSSSLEITVTTTSEDTEDRYTTYKDIEIPTSKKLQNVLIRCM